MLGLCLYIGFRRWFASSLISDPRDVSQIVLSKGSEPVLLGFKRQNVLLDGTDALVINVANAPGLPPVVAVTIVFGDGDAPSIALPEGFELVEVG